jgi:hydrogenase maturation protease
LANILVIGLGNPILGDDGVGWRIAEALKCHPDLPPGVEIDCMAVGGISLMERLIGYNQAILVDAIVTHLFPVGTVLCLELKDMPNRDIGHLGSPHDTTIQDALKMGRCLGADLPSDIKFVAVESQNVYDFSEELTQFVALAVPIGVQQVIDILNCQPVQYDELRLAQQSKELSYGIY